MLRSQLLITLLCLSCSAFAQSRTGTLNLSQDPRGQPDLTVCSQNLENYGSLNDVKTRNSKITAISLANKEKALAQRFASKQCDVIALQEVLGKGEKVALQALNNLALALRKLTNRFYEARVGPSKDPFSTVGYLVAKDRAEIFLSLSYNSIELPTLLPDGKPRDFSRGPFELQLKVGSRDGSFSKNIILVNFHLKSKRGAEDDPAALEWETWRMEMSEALRRVVSSRHKRSFMTGENILILLGDRNSNFDAASAKILEGSLTLKNFQNEGPCRLSKRGVPLCQGNTINPQRLFSVLTTDPQTKVLPGTFRFKGVHSWLDDILMPAESLRAAWVTETSVGDYDAGVVYNPEEASDHAMVYVRLNW